MNEKNDLTTGNVGRRLLVFALPYLLSSFMQTFYGMADLFVVGLYRGSATSSAVAIGSQVTHMLTVVIVGLAMGSTVRIARYTGAKDETGTGKTVGNSILLFAGFALILTILLCFFTENITALMRTPQEAVEETGRYLIICFSGIPFIVAYNVICSIFRGIGDSRSPMYFVAVACVINIVLDFVFVGGMGLGAEGAALGTILGQAFSVLSAGLVIWRRDLGFSLDRQCFVPDQKVMGQILKVGTPIACQDGLIQVAFLIITVIANSRGLTDATAVGIVEKIIGFLFLVPSAFLSAISAITAQNMGASKPERARECLRIGLMITIGWGLLCAVYNQFLPQTLVGLFTRDSMVLQAGCGYLRSYSLDCVFAAVHFCFSGYFCGNQQAMISFVHNMLSMVLIRVPGAYLASIRFPQTLYPMGLAAPLGSLLSAAICIGFFLYDRKKAIYKNCESSYNKNI